MVKGKPEYLDKKNLNHSQSTKSHFLGQSTKAELKRSIMMTSKRNFIDEKTSILNTFLVSPANFCGVHWQNSTQSTPGSTKSEIKNYRLVSSISNEAITRKG